MAHGQMEMSSFNTWLILFFFFFEWCVAPNNLSAWLHSWFISSIEKLLSPISSSLVLDKVWNREKKWWSVIASSLTKSLWDVLSIVMFSVPRDQWKLMHLVISLWAECVEVDQIPVCVCWCCHQKSVFLFLFPHEVCCLITESGQIHCWLLHFTHFVYTRPLGGDC